MCKLVSMKTFESIINLPIQKAWGTDDYTDQLYQTFEEEMMQILYNLTKKIKKKRTLPNSFYETSIILISKPVIDMTRKESYKPVYAMKKMKNPSVKYQQMEYNDV